MKPLKNTRKCEHVSCNNDGVHPYRMSCIWYISLGIPQNTVPPFLVCDRCTIWYDSDSYTKLSMGEYEVQGVMCE